MTLDWDLEQAHKHVDALAAAARAAIADAKQIKDAAGAGAPRELTPYPDAPRFDRSSLGCSAPSPETCTKMLDEWFKQCEPIHVANEAVVKHNTGLITLATAYFHSLGLKDEEGEWSGYGSRRKYHRSPAAWLSSVRGQLGRIDPWSNIMDTKRRLEEEIKTRIYQEGQARQARERAAAIEEQKRKAYAVMGALCGRYGVDPAAEMSVLVDAIIAKNKYLRLAWYLQKNRGDWSEGMDFARQGLDGFAVETPRDKEIEAELRGHIENWDGDGRIFRDCAWNYGVLFDIVAQVAPELYADYQKAAEYVIE